MLRLGELLKSKREEKELTISQVSDITKIPQKLITALEESNYDIFASEVYLKGFLRNYTKFLGIDTNKALAIFRREWESKEENTLKDTQTPMKEPKAIVTPGRLVFATTVLIVVAVIAFIAIQINVIMQPPKLTLKEPIEAQASGEVFTEVNTDTISISGKVEVGSKLLINGNEVTTNNLQEFRVDNYKLKEGSNEIHIVAQSYYFSETSEIKLTVIVKSESEEEPAEETTTEEGEEVESDMQEEIETMRISIEIGEEAVQVVLTVDNITKISDVLQPGEKLEYEAKEIFTIYSPQPQMITLKINNKEYSFSSQEENVFKLVDGKVVKE